MAREVTINDRSRQALAEINALSNTGLTAFQEGAIEIAKRIVKRVTGNLGDSIAGDNPRLRLFRIFTQTGYGGFVELGTSLMDKQPFMAPSIGQMIREFQDGSKWGT